MVLSDGFCPVATSNFLLLSSGFVLYPTEIHVMRAVTLYKCLPENHLNFIFGNWWQTILDSIHSKKAFLEDTCKSLVFFKETLFPLATMRDQLQRFGVSYVHSLIHTTSLLLNWMDTVMYIVGWSRGVSRWLMRCVRICLFFAGCHQLLIWQWWL